MSGGIEASFAQTPHIVDDGADGLPIHETYYSAVRLEQLLILWCALRRVLARNGSFSPHQAEDVKNTEFSIVNRALEVEDLDVGQHLIGEGFDQSVLDDPTIRSPGWIRETAGEENQIFLPERLDFLAQKLRP